VSLIPLGFEGESIRVVIVGGGNVGTKRAISLLDAGATVKVIAPAISAALEAMTTSSTKLSVERREFAGAADIQNCHLVVAATTSRAVNEHVTVEANAAGIPVNVADAGERGDFVFLAAHRAGPVTIGVAAGKVPNAAARIRDSIARRIDERYAEAVTQCSEIRERLVQTGGNHSWHEVAAELIDEGFCSSVEDGSFQKQAARWR
jgi:precorrin-2 dehydrogenase/sirohydrochlorin ferrochelatase